MSYPPTYCYKGHAISAEDWDNANGRLLPCGCPVTSSEGRKAEGLSSPCLVVKGGKYCFLTSKRLSDGRYDLVRIRDA